MESPFEYAIALPTTHSFFTAALSLCYADMKQMFFGRGVNEIR